MESYNVFDNILTRNVFSRSILRRISYQTLLFAKSDFSILQVIFLDF